MIFHSYVQLLDGNDDFLSLTGDKGQFAILSVSLYTNSFSFLWEAEGGRDIVNYQR